MILFNFIVSGSAVVNSKKVYQLFIKYLLKIYQFLVRIKVFIKNLSEFYQIFINFYSLIQMINFSEKTFHNYIKTQFSNFITFRYNWQDIIN